MHFSTHKSHLIMQTVLLKEECEFLIKWSLVPASEERSPDLTHVRDADNSNFASHAIVSEVLLRGAC